MVTILVTGAEGQLGQEIRFLSPNFPQFRFHFTSKEELDLTNQPKMLSLFRRSGFSYCINCAAYTAVDKAEEESDIVDFINVTGVKNLAESCALLKVPLVHISSDYVYHNSSNTPLVESDTTQPNGVYAKSKLASERAALAAQPCSIVLRTSWVYSSFGNNFVKTMLRLSQERAELKVIYDQVGSPTYARDLAFFILTALHKIEKGDLQIATVSGIYNFSNEGVTSWYDFAKNIFEIKNISCKVSPIRSADFPTAATRPPFSLMDKSKLKAAFGVEIPYWKDSLLECLKNL